MTIKQNMTAYSGQFAHALDNTLILNWYPGRIIGASRPGNALELGIGHGYTTRLFQEHFGDFTVVEGSQEIIAAFHAENPDCPADIVHAYFEDFTTDVRFETIIMGFVLEHVEDPLLILSRYRRFLAPSGRIFICVPNAESLHRRLGHEAGLLRDVMALSEGDLMLGHRRQFTLQTLRALVAQAGLREVRTEGLFLKALTTRQLEQLSLPDEILRAMMTLGVNYPELSAGILMEVASD